MGAPAIDSPTVRGVDPDLEKRLKRAASMAEQAKTNRDTQIVLAFIEGAGVREIARAVNMTHPAVKYILDKHAENPELVEEFKRRQDQRSIINEAKRQREASCSLR